MRPDDAVTGLIEQAERARANVRKSPHRQVRGNELRAALKSLAYAWFRSVRPPLAPMLGGESELQLIDVQFRVVLDSSDRNASKNTYLKALSAAQGELARIRGKLVVAAPQVQPDDSPPDFSSLTGDETMKKILVRRWDECRKCVEVGATLAGIVMMGGLLEALFVAKANRLGDKSALFRAKSTPIDSRTKKALDLREWTLRPFIEVGHELQWISQSAKDVAEVLRDYRNYVHPEKERSHGVVLGTQDSAMLWNITKNLCRQLLT